MSAKSALKIQIDGDVKSEGADKMVKLFDPVDVNATYPFMATPNPLMALIVFLQRGLGPEIGAVAAQAALQSLMASKESRQQVPVKVEADVKVGEAKVDELKVEEVKMEEVKVDSSAISGESSTTMASTFADVPSEADVFLAYGKALEAAQRRAQYLLKVHSDWSVYIFLFVRSLGVSL